VNDLAVPDTPLAIRGVIKCYGKLTALNGIDLTLEAGRFTALLGPNGAGKSTLFQLLSGLFVPDAGEIRVCGYALNEAPSRALAQLGIVFQQPTLDLDLTVEANLRFHARLHGMGRQATARIDAELDRVGLQAQRNTPCRALSGGNRRRVELARALLHEPSLLLMDEPTVGLDPASRELLVSYVHELCSDRDLAVLWATHLVDEAERAHHVVVLDQGEILTEGSPDSLVASSDAASLEGAFLNLTAITKEQTKA
jgi:ABC-2 type transport system ATP-binding protein